MTGPLGLLVNGVLCVPSLAGEMEFSSRPSEEDERLKTFAEILLGRPVLGAYRRKDGVIVVREFGDLKDVQVEVTFRR